MNSWDDAIARLRKLETDADRYDPPVDPKLLAAAIELAAALQEIGCRSPSRAYWSEESAAVMFEWISRGQRYYSEMEIADEREHVYRCVPLGKTPWCC